MYKKTRVLVRPVRFGVLTAGVFLLAGFAVASLAEHSFVPEGFSTGGKLKTGDVLVSNFNDSTNAQGKGTTIIALSPRGALAPPGTATVFFTSKLPGLSTALGVLRRGFVLVGNVPTADGTFKTIGQGALQVIDRNGTWLQTLTDAGLL